MFVNESTGKVAKLEPANRLSVFCIAIDAHHCRGMWVCTKSLLDIDLTCDVPPGAVSIVFAFVLPESGVMVLSVLLPSCVEHSFCYVWNKLHFESSIGSVAYSVCFYFLF